MHRSELSDAIHETARDLFESGIIDKKTMRDFDKSCHVKPEQFSPEEIRVLRERENVSQSVFARCLNVTKNLVSDWGPGVKNGRSATLLLSLVKKGGLERIRIEDGD